jgi:hypothetical protein
MQWGGALVRRVRGGGVTVRGRRAREARAARAAGAGATQFTTQFTCLTSTKVQVLTERVARALEEWEEGELLRASVSICTFVLVKHVN